MHDATHQGIILLAVIEGLEEGGSDTDLPELHLLVTSAIEVAVVYRWVHLQVVWVAINGCCCLLACRTQNDESIK